MQIWGKVVGVLLGFMFGRIAGAVLGLVVGHIFDQTYSKDFSDNGGFARTGGCRYRVEATGGFHGAGVSIGAARGLLDVLNLLAHLLDQYLELDGILGGAGGQ